MEICHHDIEQRDGVVFVEGNSHTATDLSAGRFHFGEIGEADTTGKMGLVGAVAEIVDQREILEAETFCEQSP